MKRLLCLLCTILILCGLCNFAQADNTPVPIATREDLLQIAKKPSGSYVLTKDIDMGAEDWIPIPFSGTFNGGGHTLYNLTIHSTGSDTATTYDGNRIKYDTVFGGLFSVVKNAHIYDLNIVNAKVTVETDRDCFIAALAGYAANSLFERCSVTARVSLTLSGTNEGVGGLIGFCDESEIQYCASESELTFIDINPDIDCEEFLGGIYASGSGRIFNCTVKTRGFAEIYGYAHNGGMVGMHKLRRGSSFRPRLVNSVSDCELTFFEVAPSMRCYRSALIGEDGAKDCYLKGNKIEHFVADYTKTERRIRPHACDEPEYEETVTEPTCSSWGHTEFTCRKCGYSYTDLYTEPAHHYEEIITPATCTENGTVVYTCTYCQDSYSKILPAMGHQPGEWTVTEEPQEQTEGREILCCVICGEVLEEKVLPALSIPEIKEEPESKPETIVEIIPVPVPETKIALNTETFAMTSGTTAKLAAEVVPSGTKVIWTSSDPNIVTVKEDGTLIANRKGTARITCSDRDGKTASSCLVTVEESFWQIFVRYVLFGWLWNR